MNLLSKSENNKTKRKTEESAEKKTTNNRETTKKGTATKKADSARKATPAGTKKTTNSKKKASSTTAQKSGTTKKQATKGSTTAKKKADSPIVVSKETISTSSKKAVPKKATSKSTSTAPQQQVKPKEIEQKNATSKKTVQDKPPTKPLAVAARTSQPSSKSDITTDVPQKKFKRTRKFFSGLGKFMWVFTGIIFSLILASTIVGTFFVYQIYLDVQDTLPPLAINDIKAKMDENSMVYDLYDQQVSELAEASYIAVDYDALPQSLVDGFVAAEDARFFTHKGVDGPRTINAVITNEILKQVTSGGSTITQQLIKVTSLRNKILTDEGYKSSNERKIHEWILAYQLEQQMSKEDIFTAYLNTLGYGRLTGVGTAAKHYFNKNISELTVAEATLLAGIPQASTANNPYGNMESATARYNTVIDLLVLHNFTSEEEAKALKAIPLADLLLTNQDEFTNQNYAYYSAVEQELNEIFNVKASENGELLPYYTGYKIFTEMDQAQQALANEIMDTENYVSYSEMLSNIPYYSNNGITDDPNLQAAFSVVNIHTGGVPAIGAARNFKSHGNNFALNGMRSPGSSIKPVIDYVPGMEKFGWTPSTSFTDKKTYYSGTKNEVYNFSNTTSDKPVSLQQAVAESLNTVAVQAIQQVGVEYAGTIAGNLGISRAKELLEENYLFESAALGGGLETTTTEMAGAYATFGNAGKYNKPHFIRRIENLKGEVVYEYKQQNTQVISVSTAKNITSALIYTRWSGTPASGRRQVNSNVTFAAKTGTSSYSTDDRRAYGLSGRAEKDHWIVGYSPEYSIAVWTGFNIEDAEFLSRTRGNVNSNKIYGSHIMTAWMNTFAPTSTSFDFSADNAKNATMSSLAVTLDQDAKIAYWNKPSASFPVSMTQETINSLGPIVYDISLITATGEETVIASALAQDIQHFNYLDHSTTDAQKIKITARFANPIDGLADSSSITLSLVSDKDVLPVEATE